MHKHQLRLRIGAHVEELGAKNQNSEKAGQQEKLGNGSQRRNDVLRKRELVAPDESKDDLSNEAWVDLLSHASHGQTRGRKSWAVCHQTLNPSFFNGWGLGGSCHSWPTAAQKNGGGLGGRSHGLFMEGLGLGLRV